MTAKLKADRIPDSQLHHHTRAYLEQVAEGRIIITTDSKPVAVLISVEDAELLDRLIREEEDRIDIAAARAAIAEGGELVPWEQIKADLGLNATLIDEETA